MQSSSPINKLALVSAPLNHIPKHHIHTSLKHVQRWQLHNFPGQSILMSDCPHCEEIIPDIQFKPLLVQPESISSCPPTYHLRKETNSLPTTTSF